ncbi:MAG: methionyl-tRNA formyltransferase, partial [Nocardia sp.]|nr:methionyl-tRNA formyltransferase [Nocardia sp.]
SAPYPRAFSHYRGRRIAVLESTLSSARYGGTPGRVIVQEDGGVVVCGPDAHRGDNHGLRITRVRDADGVEHSGAEFFRRGGYLTDTPE